MCWHRSCAVSALRQVKKNRKRGISLVEVIVVMAIVSALLLMGAVLFSGVGKSEGREAVRSLLLAGLNNAQTRALSSGEPVALVMTPYEEGREGQLGRSFTLFEVTKDEVTGDFVAGRQLRRWSVLPGRFIFSKGGTVSDAGQNAFDQSPVVNVSILEEKSEGRRAIDMPAIVFGATGNVVWPQGEGELELHVTEGAVETGMAVGTGGELNDWRQREVFMIGRQTGRARYLQTR